MTTIVCHVQLEVLIGVPSRPGSAPCSQQAVGLSLPFCTHVWNLPGTYVPSHRTASPAVYLRQYKAVGAPFEKRIVIYSVIYVIFTHVRSSLRAKSLSH